MKAKFIDTGETNLLFVNTSIIGTITFKLNIIVNNAAIKTLRNKISLFFEKNNLAQKNGTKNGNTNPLRLKFEIEQLSQLIN